MTKIHAFIDRARVVLTQAVTYIAAVSATLVLIAQNVVPELPEPIGSTVGTWVATAIAFLGGVVGIIRRVTPVPREERGILPPPSPADLRQPSFD